jgi:hypothetical protein
VRVIHPLGTGQRVGEVASLHLACLDIDEHGKPVLVYDSHKVMRLGRRLPFADSDLVEAIRLQQSWIRTRFPDTAATDLWLLPRGTRNLTGTAHIPTNQIAMWMWIWVGCIPAIDSGGLDPSGEPVPFDRAQIHPQVFRHTYAKPSPIKAFHARRWHAIVHPEPGVGRAAVRERRPLERTVLTVSSHSTATLWTWRRGYST